MNAEAACTPWLATCSYDGAHVYYIFNMLIFYVHLIVCVIHGAQFYIVLQAQRVLYFSACSFIVYMYPQQDGNKRCTEPKNVCTDQLEPTTAPEGIADTDAPFSGN